MQRAGEVQGVAQGIAVVRSPDADHPDLGATLLDENLDVAGRVVDVFGPTDQPYLAVSPPDSVALASLLGAVLYYRD